MITTIIKDVPCYIKISYEADLPVLLEGRHGIGKSSIFEQVAKELEIDLCVMDLSLLEPVDLLGIPYKSEEQTKYAPPSRLPRNGKGLLLLEELNRASPQTRAPALELLTRRQLHDYTLPSGWLPCASINPDGEEYSVDPLDPALTSRFMILRVEPDHQGWLDWAKKKEIHPLIISYVSESPDIFTMSDVNPRSLTYASNFLKSFETHDETDPSILANAWSGLVGTKIATALLRFYQGATVSPSPKEIIKDYIAVRPTVRKIVDNGQLDLITSSLKKLKRHLQKQKNWNKISQSKTAHANLTKFLEDIPADMKTNFDDWLAERGYQKESN